MSVYASNKTTTGSGSGGVTVYTNLAAFPASAPNGTLAVAGDTHIVYEYNSTAVAWQPVASNAAYNSSSTAPTSIGALDAQAANATGLALVSQVLSTQSADATHPGMVNTTTQSFAGNKTFTGTVAASNLSGTNTGDQTITLTSDVTGSGTGSFATTVAKIQGTTVSGTTGTTNVVFSASPTLTGTLSAATISASGTITGSNLSGTNTGNQTITLTGDVTGSGTGSFATTTAKIQGTTISGTTGTTNVVFSASPTLTGTLSAATISASGAVTGSNLSGTNTGDVTLTAVGATPNANAASLSGQALNLQPANGSFPGVVTTGTQTFAGAKTFTSDITSTNFRASANGSFFTGTGTTFVATDLIIANNGSIVAIDAPLRLNGSTSGYVGISGGTTPTSYTVALPSSAPATGQVLTAASASTTTWATTTSPTSNLRYYSSTTTISGSLVPVVYATQDYDATSMYSSGVATILKDGKYQVNAALLVTGTISLNNTVIMEIQKNGTVVSRATEYVAAALTDVKINISDIISAVFGDLIVINVSTTITTPSIVSSDFDNYVSIANVGT